MDVIEEYSVEVDNRFESDFLVLKDKEGTLFYGVSAEMKHEDFQTIAQDSIVIFEKAERGFVEDQVEELGYARGRKEDTLSPHVLRVREAFVQYPGISCSDDSRNRLHLLFDYAPLTLE